jgi:hypothetical protein
MKLVEVEPGTELLRAVRALRDVAYFQASGFVSDVQMRIAGEGVDPKRRLSGRWALVTMAAKVEGPFGAVLSRATVSGIETVAGFIEWANSEGVTLALWSAEPGETASVSAPSTSSPSAKRADASGTADSSGSGWAATALAIATDLAPEPDAEEATPERGDRVHHFTFGLCDVLTTDGDRLKIRDVSGPGRIREIRTDMLDIGTPSVKDGKRIFPLKRRG